MSVAFACAVVALVVAAITTADFLRRASDFSSMLYLALLSIALIALFWVRRLRLGECHAPRIARPTTYLPGLVMLVAGIVVVRLDSLASWSSAVGGSLILVGSIGTFGGRDLLCRFAPVVALLVFLVRWPDDATRRVAEAWDSASRSIAGTFSGAPLCEDGASPILSSKDLVPLVVLTGFTFAFLRNYRVHARVLLLIALPVLAVLGGALLTLVRSVVGGPAQTESSSGSLGAPWLWELSCVLVVAIALQVFVRVLRSARIPLFKKRLLQGG